MERLVDWFIALMMQPWVLKLLGKILLSLSPIAIAAGYISIKYEHRISRLFNKLHTLSDGRAELPATHGLFEQWPLIQAAIPETFMGFFTWVCIFLTGAMMMCFGKQIERMY